VVDGTAAVTTITDTIDNVYLSITGPSTIEEGSTSTAYTLYLKDNADNLVAPVTDVIVTVTYSGTASDGVDYVAETPITISAGETSTTFTLTSLDDFIVEDAETIELVISTESSGGFENLAVDTNNNGVITTIVDNDNNPVATDDPDSASPYSISVGGFASEGDGWQETDSNGEQISILAFDIAGNSSNVSTQESYKLGVSASLRQYIKPEQLEYDAETGTSEALLFQFSGYLDTATVQIDNLFESEKGGNVEQGRWVALLDGTVVAQGTFSGGPGNTATLEIGTEGGPLFNELRFEALPYSQDDKRLDDNSDFFVSAISGSGPADANGSYVTTEDSPLTIAAAAGVLSNDSDSDAGDVVSIVSVLIDGEFVMLPESGTLTLTSGATLALATDGSFTYDPNGQFDGLAAGQTTTDSFVYRIQDQHGNSLSLSGGEGTQPGDDDSVATATITLVGLGEVYTPPAARPYAAEDSYQTYEGTVLSVTSSGLISNDYDRDGDNVSAVVVTDAVTDQGGIISINSDGSFSYTPRAGYVGTDSYTYTISDADGNTDTAVIQLRVDPMPEAVSASAATDDADTVGDAKDTVSGSLQFQDVQKVTFDYDGGLGAATESRYEHDGQHFTKFEADDGSWMVIINETTGDYSFNQYEPYEHAAGADAISGSISMDITEDGQSDATLQLTINDDGVAAVADSSTVPASGIQVTPERQNVMLILDNSETMSWEDNREELLNALDQLFNSGNVNAVRIVLFSSEASAIDGPVDGWFTNLADARTAILAGLAGGGSVADYDAALAETISSFTAPPAGGDSLISLFIASMRPTGRDGTNWDSVNSSEERAWIDFLNDNDFDASYAMGLGDSLPAGVIHLEPIADQRDAGFFKPNDSADADAIRVGDYDLSDSLVNFVSQPITILSREGNVLTNDSGADTPLTVIGATIRASTNTGYSSDVALVLGSAIALLDPSGSEFGHLTLYADGSYQFELVRGVAIDTDLTVIIEYTVQDSEGDTATTTLSLNADAIANQQHDAPIAVDLDGNGIEYLERAEGVVFTDETTGESVSTAWVGPNDGLLVIDADDSGTINQSSEYVFTEWSETATTDMAAVAEVFDTNQDGQLSALDSDFEQFAVWRDADSDGITDDGELVSLIDLGVESIALNYADDSREGLAAGGDVIIYGQSEVVFGDGTTTTAEDAGFAIEAADLLGEEEFIPLPGDADDVDIGAALSVTGYQPGTNESGAAFDGLLLEADLLLNMSNDKLEFNNGE
jgi:hypothetical protein